MNPMVASKDLTPGKVSSGFGTSLVLGEAQNLGTGASGILGGETSSMMWKVHEKCQVEKEIIWAMKITNLVV